MLKTAISFKDQKEKRMENRRSSMKKSKTDPEIPGLFVAVIGRMCLF